MTTPLDLAKATLLDKPGLNDSAINKVMDRLLSRQIDAADLYFQYSRLESWILDDGIIKEGNHNIEQGAGLRAISGEKTGFAYTDELSTNALLDAASAARAIAHHQQDSHFGLKSQRNAKALYPAINPLDTLSESQKLDLMKKLDALARAQDPRVKQVTVSMVAAHDTILVINEQGEMAGDVRPLVRMNVSVIVEQNGRREQASCGGGARTSLEFFLNEDKAEDYAKEAVRQALVNLDAVDAPAGMLPVVLGPGWPGILLHEAVGHGLEGDFNRKGTSAFSGKVGQRVAAPHCTIVDDGTLPDRRGSLAIDDEGTPGQYNVLVENGVLRGYMQDKMNARLMGVAPTGNGRRESFAHMPMPRMTNTYMLAGPHEQDEIIASVKKGLYAPNFGGGQVDITSGKFVFSASEAYLIENGTITAPVKGAMLIGDGPDALTRISMVGNNLELDDGVGTCGKEGQSVPVGVGQPTLKIDELTVGGTA